MRYVVERGEGGEIVVTVVRNNRRIRPDQGVVSHASAASWGLHGVGYRETIGPDDPHYDDLAAHVPPVRDDHRRLLALAAAHAEVLLGEIRAECREMRASGDVSLRDATRIVRAEIARLVQP